MLNITIEINGKPLTESNFRDAFEAAAIEGIRDNMQEALERGLTPAELSQLTVKLVGNSLSNLSLNLNGPDDIIEKAQRAVGAT